MASKFQNRLVGTILLVSIGVIVLPDVLDGKKTHYEEEIASIPIKPELDSDVESFDVLEPVDDTASLPETPVELVQDIEPSVEATDDKPLPVAIKEVPERNEYQDSAWIIQLMALKNAENAKNVVKDLQKRGYQAHTKLENGFTRVIIGPDVSKNKLEQQVTELEKITGSKGRLLKFKPLNP
ncbi:MULTISPECIES: SPOR domain-containing protein [Vibrio]|uniref:SPOR domain-containing protein n=1 Tax=Vibrio neptunius TaxID=170651 RepID=A0ABS3A0R6_9VIBR|nr:MULTISPECIES: SPOR domain-containing protein [Vibrio]MBN3491624.1 SPOR domain-containing protein [Vibrio neptunius]MBN3514195.1 SPOR domain-containing protein [Vibrio neptunius]MBN3548987.1 SPOR domain-containing protein [Vibrio neptunius]MBN3577449.1 SPOR domain-containing protein [Vibrio neptunius]MCH9871113.1 SPOR domain-containing protein [Vibrio neptunius]